MNTVCQGTPTILSSTSTDGTFPIVSCVWTNPPASGPWGPSGSNICNTSFTFNSAGPQGPTTLTVSDYLGCSHTITDFAFV